MDFLFLRIFLWIYIKTGLGLTITQYTEYNTFTPEHLKTCLIPDKLYNFSTFLWYIFKSLRESQNLRSAMQSMSCTNVKCYSWIVFGVISSVTLMSLLKYYRYPQQTCYDKTDGNWLIIALNLMKCIFEISWLPFPIFAEFPTCDRERFRTRRLINNRGLYTFAQIWLYSSQFNITRSVLRSISI